jgi:fimbrial chaperone protein
MLFIVTRVTRLANLLAVVVMLILAWPANAMIVSPLTLDLTSSGANNKATLTVTNDSAAEIPVEIVISRISINEKGETKEEPVKGSFLVFPSQQRIPAGGRQSFRLQWIGAADMKATETFMFSVNQLPIAMDAKKSGVQLVMNFLVLVNVSPLKAQHAVKLIKADLVNDGKNGRRPVLTLSNTGNRYAMLSDGSITLTNGTWTKTYSGTELVGALGGMGLLQPGKERRFTMDTKIPIEVSRIDARVEVRAAR